MDRSPERLLMAAILAHFGDSIEIPIGAVLEAEDMGGYRVHDTGRTLRLTLVHETGHIQAAE